MVARLFDRFRVVVADTQLTEPLDVWASDLSKSQGYSVHHWESGDTIGVICGV